LKTVCLIFGTRPEAIKLCPLVLELRKHATLAPQVCVTAQHRELLDQVLSVFGVVPDIDLDLMKLNQTLSGLTADALKGLDEYLAASKPDLVVVQGDTTTTFCAALAAFYNQIPVAHVEAGLRTWNKLSPYPEEINRALTTQLSDYHFAATEWAKENLLREGVRAEQIFVTGNTVVDALHLAIKKTRSENTSIPGLPEALANGHSSKPIVLITGHRRESFGPGFRSICEAIRRLATQFSETAFVYPVHLNPNVQGPVFQLLKGIDNVFLLPPLDYLSFVALLDRSKFIMTDSGGIQEEAPSLGKPVLVMRNTTERPEAVKAGTAVMVGTDVEQIVLTAGKFLSNNNHNHRGEFTNPFGDGLASRRIVQIIESKLELNQATQ
jgi:UDP-N-acetylglucosamine 2-epimerase (non-hydrolysing)